MRVRSEDPRSRRERPAKPALTRDGIVNAAIDIMREEGLQKVTTRRIAEVLDTGPASLYVYVSNTAELHALILDKMLGTLEVPVGGAWDERLERLLAAYTLMLYEHGGLARSALVARPNGPNYMRLVETLLALLDEGDTPAGQAAWGIDLLLQQATASAAEHAGRQQSGGEQGEWDALTRALREAPADTHPHVAALAATLVSGSPQERTTWATRVLLNGIRATALPQTPRQADDPS